MFTDNQLQLQIQQLTRELQDLIYEFNVQHRSNMIPVFNELLKCVMCGVVESVRLYVDRDIEGKAVICCGLDCQECFYYKKRNYFRAARKANIL